MARSKQKSASTFKRLFIVVVVSVIGIGIYNFYLGSNGGFFPGAGELSYDEAASRLPRVLDDVDWSENFVQRRANIDLVQDADLKDTLPDIGQFSSVVLPPLSGNDVVVEIFVSSEKSGKGTDGWMVETSRAFNDAGKRLSSGRVAKVKIRKIASGTGYQFIASRKHLPQAYSPSNHLWIRMAEAHGIPVAPIREKLVGNIAGVVMKTEVAEKLKSTYGTLDVKNIIDAVVQGNVVMGYTNPFASSTGLNFLVTILSTFAAGDEANMLSPDVISAFEGFQRGVPFVAQTTLQMRDSVEKGGALEAFVMEYQTFAKTRALQSGYEFIPFGIRHDNPLYAVGDLTPDQVAALKEFAAFTDQAKYQDLANEYGFNPSLAYDPAFQIPAGNMLIEGQMIWKQKKDAGRAIAAVFLADVSGSMSGSRIRGVKEALIRGSDFIEPGNSIGLVLFSNVVPVHNLTTTFKPEFSTLDIEGTLNLDGTDTVLAQGVTVDGKLDFLTASAATLELKAGGSLTVSATGTLVSSATVGTAAITSETPGTDRYSFDVGALATLEVNKLSIGSMDAAGMVVANTARMLACTHVDSVLSSRYDTVFSGCS